ncbi:hypothetical protein A6O24_15540 [Acidithiobacillus thiooxidans]|uniref:Uncharacterized protein n=1 Tax=Acidithiobacillus thiooxidans TaxID=930 RepID=A0A1C2I5S4_ACITH|nr:hypothetical protein A6O24_15540 [Acidithiobacillus thiooxidans]OCX74730.1 hypothetical protein A6M23_05015 [Acidithiobacillus thiooxidans]OCX82999.1 hypothetical protein A6O26_08180 [Acidithiobacillus thiooxidans]
MKDSSTLMPEHWQMDKSAPAEAFMDLQTERLWDDCCKASPEDPGALWYQRKNQPNMGEELG